MTVSSKPFEIQEQDTHTLFRITRPQRLNAMTLEVLYGLSDCIDDLERKRGRALIVTAEGDRAFSAGTDLFEKSTLTDEEAVAKNDFARDLLLRLSRAPFLSVAAVNGLAYGGGLELAMGCLFRVSAPQATFSLPEVKLGLIPTYAGTQFLPAIVGSARALDLMLTGRAIGADEALAMGLVNRVAEEGQPVQEAATEFLASITCHSQVAIDAIRQSVAASGAVVTEQGLEVERRAVAVVANSEDAVEGVAAFKEKRAPQFKHR